MRRITVWPCWKGSLSMNDASRRRAFCENILHASQEWRSGTWAHSVRTEDAGELDRHANDGAGNGSVLGSIVNRHANLTPFGCRD